MRKSWPFLVGVTAVGVLAGVAIVGRPATDDPFILDAPSSDTSTTVAVSTTTVEPPETTDPDDSPAATSTTDAGPATTDATATTDAGPTTTEVQGENITLDRSQVRIVLANGDGRSGLATSNADRLRFSGYTAIEVTDVEDRPLTTVIFYRAGFEEESLNLRADLGTPGAFITILTEPVTGVDDAGDLIVVLGPDAAR